MSEFDVLKMRGHVGPLSNADLHDFRRRMVPSEDGGEGAGGPVPAPRAGGRKTSNRDYRGPQDLMRSRRVGLSQTICRGCGAVKDQNPTRHHKLCPITAGAGEFIRLTTGPMLSKETSKDVGWR